MNDPNTIRLGRYIERKRRALGLSIRGLAATAGIDASGLSRLERGRMGEPSPLYLQKLALALELDPSDLYLEAGYTGVKQLPGLVPYLRAKYELPDEAVEQLSAYFDFINSKYDKDKNNNGEEDHHEQHHS